MCGKTHPSSMMMIMIVLSIFFTVDQPISQLSDDESNSYSRSIDWTFRPSCECSGLPCWRRIEVWTEQILSKTPLQGPHYLHIKVPWRDAQSESAWQPLLLPIQPLSGTSFDISWKWEAYRKWIEGELQNPFELKPDSNKIFPPIGCAQSALGQK